MYPMEGGIPPSIAVEVLPRDPGTEPCSLTTTISSTLTLTSTIYNNKTITRTYTLNSASASSAARAAALETPVVLLPSVTKASSVSPTSKSTAQASATASKPVAIATNKNSTSSSNKPGSSSGAGRAAGITLGTIAGAALIFCLVVICCRGRRRNFQIKAKKSEKQNASSPSVEAGQREKYIFSTRNDRSGDTSRITASNTYNPPSNDKPLPSPPTQAFLAANGMIGRASSHMSQIHPAFRYSKEASVTANQSAQKSDSRSISDASRFYSSNNNSRDNTSRSGSSASRHADDLYPPWNNVASHALQAAAFRPAFAPSQNTDRKLTSSENVVSTPIDKVGPRPESASLLHHNDTNFAYTSSATSQLPSNDAPTWQPEPSRYTSTGADNLNTQTLNQLPQTTYVLPSQRTSRTATPIVWTDASIPLDESDPPLPVPPLPLPPSDPATPSSFIAFGLVPPSQLKTTTVALPTSGTTTESDVLSPRHEGQEPSRRRKSLFQSSEGCDSGKDDRQSGRGDGSRRSSGQGAVKWSGRPN